MTEQNPDSNLKDRKWFEALTTRTLEAGLTTLWLNEFVDGYNARMAAATTPEERKAIREEYEGPDDEFTNEFVDLPLEPELEAQMEAAIDPSRTPSWLSNPVNARIAQLELDARRKQELSAGKAASAAAASDRCDQDTAVRRAIVKLYPKMPFRRLCELLDTYHVPLPSGPFAEDWAVYKDQTHAWSKAYRAKELHRRVIVNLSKDKKA